MGSGASAGLKAATEASSQEEVNAVVSGLDDSTKEKLRQALAATEAAQPAATAEEAKPVAAEEKAIANSAFIFVKPHAVTDAVKKLVSDRLTAAGMTITSEGEIKAEEIDSKKLIDAHYGAIAAKAMDVTPANNLVPEKAQEEFKKVFGLDWKETLANGQVYNAAEASKKLEIDYNALGAKWRQLKKGEGLLKFSGGFYCGKIDDIFVINGFYMDMRRAYTTLGTSIFYYAAEWPADKLCWADFRGKVLGTTDPSGAVAGSLRNDILKDWQAMGLKCEPDISDNGVHASASPFENLCERTNWLGAGSTETAFGKALVEAGVPEETIKAWANDPTVDFEGQNKSIFDRLEDLDASDCLERAAKIAAVVGK